MANLPPPAERVQRGKVARARLVRNSFTPDFWNNLGRVHITEESLEEVSRRDKTQRWQERHDWIDQLREGDEAQAVAGGISLSRFAMRNGPDMAVAMEHEWRSNAAEGPPAVTVPAYPRFPAGSRHFLQHMQEHNIEPIVPQQHDLNQEPPPRPRPADINELVLELTLNFNAPTGPNPLWSWDNNAIREFQAMMAPEGNVLVPAGNEVHRDSFFGRIMTEFDKMNAEIPHKEFLLSYRQAHHITNRTLRGPIPDLVDGARLNELHPVARANRLLCRYIRVDGTNEPGANDLILPTFVFDEGPVALQSCYEGAFGARACQALRRLYSKLHVARTQNNDLSLQELTQADMAQPIMPETLSHGATIWQGVLKLFSWHMELDDGGDQTIWMTQLGNYHMFNTIEHFRAGALAFANLRQSAMEDRNNLIRRLNLEYYYRGYGTVDAPHVPPVHPPPAPPQ